MSLFLTSAFAVGADGGSLTGISQTAPASSVNLTSEGQTDWAHWGLSDASSFNHKSGVSSQIGNYTLIGSEAPSTYNSAAVAYSWTDGTPTSSVSSTTRGLRLFGVGNGFQLTVPADTTDKTLKLYVGVKNATGRLEATLSDGSAAPYVAFVQTAKGRTTDMVTLDFRAAAAGASLIVSYTLDTAGSGNSHIRLEAATLMANDTSGDGSNDGATDSVPHAVPDSVTNYENAPVVIDVLANDSGLNDTPLTVTVPSSPSNGATSVLNDNTIEYTPDAGFSGEDSFFYRVTDADGDTAMSSVTITIQCLTCTSDISLTLIWDPNPESDNVLGYRVYAGETPITTTTLVSDLSIDSGDITAQTPSVTYNAAADLQLNSGDTICFTVTAYNRGGESGFAEPKCTTL